MTSDQIVARITVLKITRALLIALALGFIVCFFAFNHILFIISAITFGFIGIGLGMNISNLYLMLAVKNESIFYQAVVSQLKK